MTKLGNDKQLRKSGRYARVMGTLWRHRKREKCGRAAMGLLLDIWSRCADQSEDFISEKGMRQLINGDPNGRRELKELIAAGFVDQVEGGYVPHDWDEHSAFGATSDARATTDETRDATGLATRDVTGDAMSSPPENNQESTSPRACASPKSPSLQVSSEKNSLLRMRVREVPSERPGEFTSERQAIAFRGAYERRMKTAPTMGGKQVGEFHDKVLSTARLQGRDPRELFLAVLETWLSKPHTEIERGAPYACFCAAWGKLTSQGEAAASEPPSARDTIESLTAQAQAAISRGDLAAATALNKRREELKDREEQQRRRANGR